MNSGVYCRSDVSVEWWDVFIDFYHFARPSALLHCLVQFSDVLISSLPFSVLRAAPTARWSAQHWAATARAVHFAITTCVLLKQVRLKQRVGVKHKCCSCTVVNVSLLLPRLLSERR